MKRLPAAFYRSVSGREPVRIWLKSLGAEDRKAIGDDIRTVEFGWPIGMPICRPMGQGLFEVRTDLPGGRIARVLFVMMSERFYSMVSSRKPRRRHRAIWRRRVGD